MRKKRRRRKLLGWVGGVLVLMSGLIVAVIGCRSRYETTAEKLDIVEGASSLENGKNLTFNICGQCHYDPKTERFSGLRMHDLPGFMGKVYSANLTHSSSFGVLDKYTDAQLAYLLKTGIAKDGRYVPYMIRPNMADEDVNDILVFLRSKAMVVSAADTVPGQTHVNAFGKFATKLAGKPLPYRSIRRTDERDSIAYGRYLVDNLACYHCHSKSIITLNYLVPENSKGYMAGGMKFKYKGRKVYASNLTSEKETGIGKYDLLDFRRALQRGLKPSGESIRKPMQQFPYLTNKQCDAIYYYLHSIAPKWNKVRGR